MGKSKIKRLIVLKRFFKVNIRGHAFLLIGAVWLFVISLIFSNYWSFTSSAKGVRKNLERYLQSQERDAYSILKDTSLILKISENQINETDNSKLISKKYGIFVYKVISDSSVDLRYWNTQMVLPDKLLCLKDTGQYLQNMGNGQYDLIIHDLQLKAEHFRVLIFIPIRWDFFVENNYLKNGFVSQLNADINFEITSTPSNYPVKSLNGRVLYFLNERKGSSVFENDWVTIILRILSVLVFMLFIQELAIYISRKFGRLNGIFSLVIMILIFRIFTYIINFPLDFRQFELFSPTIYGSNFILKSLGDLIINALLFLWLVIFIKNNITEITFSFISRKKINRFFLLIFLIGIYSLLTTLFCLEIQNLVSDSSISFDVINYFSLNIFTLFGLLALCILAIGYSYATQILFQFINDIDEVKMLIRVFVNLVLGFSLIFLFSGEFSYFQIFVLLWMIIYLISSDKTYLKGKYSLSVNQPIRWLLLYSIMITFLISAENNKKELENRIRAAEKIAKEVDPFTEKIFSLSVSTLSNVFWNDFIHSVKNKELTERFFDSIPLLNFNPSLNKYKLSFSFFDSIGNTIVSNDMDFKTIDHLFSYQSKNTLVEGLRYFENEMNQYTYIYQKKILDKSNKLKGYFFIITNPHREKSSTIISELFKITDPNSIYKNSIYSYAIYDSGSLISHFNDYSFASTLEPNEIKFKNIKVENVSGISRVWYKTENNRIVLIIRKTNYLIERLTLFAYLFCIFLLLFGLIQAAGFIVESRFNILKIRRLVQFNIKTQIFYTIILMSFISFLFIGITTVYFFNVRYKRNNEEKISKSINIFSDEFRKDFNYEIVTSLENLRLSSKLSPEVIEKILEIAEIQSVDINIYDLSGKLILSTQPYIYNKRFLSSMMNPMAFHQLNKLRKINYLQLEKTGDFEYLSIYTPIEDNNRNKLAYINIPYFSAHQELNQEISNFLVALINLNTFIFLIAGLIAVFITLRITSSFEWIGRKMREVNIGTNNELISWNWNDEIGGLVNEYNKMVIKLDNSVKSLAKNEREGAWREMARQVAHEIKNPLTPMKLSIQYLQRSIDTNASNIKELTASVAKTLIEQIEHLSKIASEFSQFANIGNVKNEKIDIGALISSMVSFHATQDLKLIEWSPTVHDVFIMADRTQMNRLFNNLIRNAIESIPEDKIGKVSISTAFENKSIIVEICDNGAGIPENMHDKIFSPNFTTKTSGTGLGLAICKGIVEQASGNIWFKSNELSGTCFYVSFPVVTIT